LHKADAAFDEIRKKPEILFSWKNRDATLLHRPQNHAILKRYLQLCEYKAAAGIPI
jgi:hypothetical protein